MSCHPDDDCDWVGEHPNTCSIYYFIIIRVLLLLNIYVYMYIFMKHIVNYTMDVVRITSTSLCDHKKRIVLYVMWVNITRKLVGGFYRFEKYARQIGSFPR